jgi:AcrR family transcriptional regulator
MAVRENTPWGWTDEVAADRLRPGPGQPEGLVEANQRQRMFAAAVAAVIETGYRDTRVADIVQVSGVSRSAFYKHFADKADCFRETAKAIWEVVYAEVLHDHAPRLEVAAVAAWADRYPACARFVLDAPDRYGRELLEKEIEIWHAVFARRWGCPPLVARAVVAGGLRLAAEELRDGLTAESFVGVDGGILVDAYGRGAISVRRVTRKLPKALAPVPIKPRDRFLAAIRDELAVRQGERPSVIDVVKRAKASLSTFYALFNDLDDLIDQAQCAARDHAYRYSTVGDWLGWLASHPADARLAIFHGQGLRVPPTLLGNCAREVLVADAVVTAFLVAEIEAGRGTEVHRYTALVEQLIALPAGAAQKAVAA